MKNIAVFASGNGSNAEQIGRHFEHSKDVRIKLILTNNPLAGVLKRADQLKISTIIFDRNIFYNSNEILDILKNNQIEMLVLAGFLWLIPNNILTAYTNRIVNIHPALLPKYGGKGMYGHHVHEAVLKAGESKSGITIHLVNEKYDEGKIIFQKEVEIDEDETPDSLASKIHQLEHHYFPVIIEKFIREMN